MIYSVHPLEEMRNPVTLGANIKHVLIKLCEEAENEVAFHTPCCLSAGKLLDKIAQKACVRASLEAPFYPSSQEFLDGFFFGLVVICNLLFWRQLTCNCVIISLRVY